jgi:AcrR family transcriptional regulator
VVVASPIGTGPEDVSAVRRAIEEKALEVFAEKGYHAASIREIVDAAGVTAPTLYYHFGNKEGLFRHLVQQLSSQLTEESERISRAPEPIRDRLVALIRAYILGLRDKPLQVLFLHRVMHGQFYQNQPHELPPDHMDGGALRRVLVEAVTSGELCQAPAELLMNSLMGALSMYMIRRIIRLAHPKVTSCPNIQCVETKEADPADAELIVDLFLAGAMRPNTP